MSAEFITQLIEYRYLILGIVFFISLLAMGLLGKFIKGAIKWVFIGLIIVFLLASLGFFSNEEVITFMETFTANVKEVGFDKAILDYPIQN